MLLIGRVWVCAGVEWMLRVLIKARMQTPAGEYAVFMSYSYQVLLPSPASAPLSDGFLNYLRLSFSSITLFPRASPSSTVLFVAHNNLMAQSLPPAFECFSCMKSAALLRERCFEPEVPRVRRANAIWALNLSTCMCIFLTFKGRVHSKITILPVFIPSLYTCCICINLLSAFKLQRGYKYN